VSLNLRNSTDFTSERSGSQSLHLKAGFESLPPARNPIAIAHELPARTLPHAMEHILV
jgi:hypothetical protein